MVSLITCVVAAFRFQEIVPLNAGNVLGTEDNEPAKKWRALVRRTLNSLPGTSGVCRTPSPIPNPIAEMDVDFEGTSMKKDDPSPFLHRRSFQSSSYSMRVDHGILPTIVRQPHLDRRFSVCDRVMFGSRPSDYDYSYNYNGNYQWNNWYNSPEDEENGQADLPGYYYNYYHSPTSNNRCASMDRESQPGRPRYCLVASKQMVGIFLMVWVRSDIRDCVRNLKASCVGRGLMGYLGNKVTHFLLLYA